MTLPMLPSMLPDLPAPSAMGIDPAAPDLSPEDLALVAQILGAEMPAAPAGPTRDPEKWRLLGAHFQQLFQQYRSDRVVAEQKWLRNLRQYLGIYDPDIEKAIPANKSRAYPRLTRIKCLSVVARLMNLLFPGNERNWSVTASPSADMRPEDVMQAVMEMQQDGTPDVSPAAVRRAVQRLAETRAEELVTLIDDQLQEIGGDQSLDYVGLNRKVVLSGVMYGLGVVRGPFVRAVEDVTWTVTPDAQGQLTAAPQTMTLYRPQFDHVPVWDFYPDMSAKTMANMDGYFMRFIMSRAQVRELTQRPGFLETDVTEALKLHPQGNFKPQTFETELRTMGVKTNVNEQKMDTSKYEIIVWNGLIRAEKLLEIGVTLPSGMTAEQDVDAEVWMLEDRVLKADLSPWQRLGVRMKTIHTFLFDEDDTSPVGNGLPAVMRDSQMAVAAAARMLLDNASITCGPNLEVNLDLVRTDQDLTSIEAYKIWYREGTGADAQYPAVKKVDIDGHIPELLNILKTFGDFADAETFVGPATGGDIARTPSESMRTAVGASMLRGDAALPFKDVVRNFDTFTQSVIYALVLFNKQFNANRIPQGDFHVIARGATSLIAKEVRGMQLDMLAQTLSPEERVHVDERKFIEQRMAVRDLENLLVSPEVAVQRKQQAAQQAEQAAQQQQQLAEATVRKVLADAYKNIAQGQKNAALADATQAKTILDMLLASLEPGATSAPEAAA